MAGASMEKTGGKRALQRAKVKRRERERLKYDDVVVGAECGDNFWSCGLKDRQTMKIGQEKKHHMAASNVATKRDTTS